MTPHAPDAQSSAATDIRSEAAAIEASPLVYRRVGLITAILDYVVELVMAVLPHDGLSNRIKRVLLQCRGATIGRRVKFWRGVWVADPRQLTLGDDITIGKDAMLISVAPITVGDRVMLAHGSKLVAGGHGIPEDDQPMRTAPQVCKPITIEADAWVAAGAIVLPGVTVGRGAVVAAGAVVSRDVPSRAIVGGVPAREIRRRGSSRG